MVVTCLCAKFRHRTTRRLGEIGHRQNEQTLKYLVDCKVCQCSHSVVVLSEYINILSLNKREYIE